MGALNFKRDVTYPIIAPIGHHSPKNGKTKDWLLRSVISHSTDGITATLPENRPASSSVRDGYSKGHSSYQAHELQAHSGSFVTAQTKSWTGPIQRSRQG